MSDHFVQLVQHANFPTDEKHQQLMMNSDAAWKKLRPGRK